MIPHLWLLCIYVLGAHAQYDMYGLYGGVEDTGDDGGDAYDVGDNTGNGADGTPGNANPGNQGGGTPGSESETPTEESNNLEDAQVSVECGAVPGDTMNVTYRGPGVAVYPRGSLPECTAQEVEPFVFHLEHAERAACNPRMDVSTNTRYLDLVAQQGPTRQATDPVHSVQCAYTRTHEASPPVQAGFLYSDLLKWNVDFERAGGTAPGEFQIDVTMLSGDSVELGSPCKLTIKYYPSGGEKGFRVWNCMVVDQLPNPTAMYPLLLSGCGDGYAVARHRGFFTIPHMFNKRGGSYYLAKGPVFRILQLSSSQPFQVACHFIVCNISTHCNKQSCRNPLGAPVVGGIGSSDNSNINSNAGGVGVENSNSGNSNSGNSNSGNNNASGRRKRAAVSKEIYTANRNLSHLENGAPTLTKVLSLDSHDTSPGSEAAFEFRVPILLTTTVVVLVVVTVVVWIIIRRRKKTEEELPMLTQAK